MIILLLVWALAATLVAGAFAAHVRGLRRRHGLALGTLSGQLESARHDATRAWARAQHEANRRGDVEKLLEKFVADLMERVRSVATAPEKAALPAPATPAGPRFGPKTRAALKTKAIGMPRQSRLAMEAAAERLVADHWDDERVALAVMHGDLAIPQLRAARAPTPATSPEG